MKAALIVDGQSLARWQHDALERCAGRLDIALVLECTNTRTRKRPLRHAGYYLMNLLMMRGRWQRRVPLPASVAGAPVMKFASEYDGAWQRVPAGIAEALRREGIEVAVKFGMNLLVDPDALGLRHGVLSFHHGDPVRYRGRPAGFYEVFQRAAYQGVVVQRLSNRLDGGAVIAQVRSKVVLHSYPATLANAYRNSVPLLARAIDNLTAGREAAPGGNGTNHRLPSNSRVLVFIGKLLYRTIRRWIYGAVVEKRWNVGFARAEAGDVLCEGADLVLDAADVPRIDARYVMYADPFPLEQDRKYVVEAVNRRNGRGELVVLDRAGSAPVRLSRGGEHYSYPGVIGANGRRYILPEVAYWSAPFLLQLADDGLEVVAEIPIAGMEARPIVDPTYVEHDGVHYLFGGHHGSELDCLNVYWSRDSLFGPYRSHPGNPVVIDPGAARMAGAFVRRDGRLYRLGQDNSYAYGDGITVLEVMTLTPGEYDERVVRRIAARGVSGPHTLNFMGDSVVFDFYRDQVAPAAGLRRVLARVRSRRQHMQGGAEK